MNCPHCGEEIEDGSTFCSECLTLIDDVDSAGSSTTDSDDPGFSFSLPSISRRQVLVSIIILIVASGASVVLFTDIVNINNIRETTSDVSDTTREVINGRVTASADEVVVQIDQLDLGWQVDSSGEGNEALLLTPVFRQNVPSTAYTTRFEKEETGERLISTVAVMNSSENSSDQYNEYMSNASTEYSTESVDIGEAGFVYTEGGTTVVVYHDRNVFGIISHTTGSNRPAINRSIEYANLMIENAE